jgi:hypothetical protein
MKNKLLEVCLAFDLAIEEIDSDRTFRRALHEAVDDLRRKAGAFTRHDTAVDVIGALLRVAGSLLGFSDANNPTRRLRRSRFSQGVGDEYFLLCRQLQGKDLQLEATWHRETGDSIASEAAMGRFLVWVRDNYPQLYREVF